MCFIEWLVLILIYFITILSNEKGKTALRGIFLVQFGDFDIFLVPSIYIHPDDRHFW